MAISTKVRSNAVLNTVPAYWWLKESSTGLPVLGTLLVLLFAATLILIRVKMPQRVGNSAEWINSERDGILTATKLMPFAGISFLWFIGVVRDGFGRYEDRFFASVFLRSGLLS